MVFKGAAGVRISYEEGISSWMVSSFRSRKDLGDFGGYGSEDTTSRERH